MSTCEGREGTGNRRRLLVVCCDTADDERHDETGSVLPVAILFLGILLTVFIGVHVVLISVSRSSVQWAADAAVAAAQAAGPGVDGGGEIEPGVTGSARQCAAIFANSRAYVYAGGSVAMSDLPRIEVDTERGIVHVISLGITMSPVFGPLYLQASACGPLDDVPLTQLSATTAWRC